MVPEIWCTTDGQTDRRTEKVTRRAGCPTGFDLSFWNAVIKNFVTDYPSATLCWVLKEENFYSNKLSQTNYFLYSLKIILFETIQKFKCFFFSVLLIYISKLGLLRHEKMYWMLLKSNGDLWKCSQNISLEIY